MTRRFTHGADSSRFIDRAKRRREAQRCRSLVRETPDDEMGVRPEMGAIFGLDAVNSDDPIVRFRWRSRAWFQRIPF